MKLKTHAVFREQLDPNLVHFIKTTETVNVNYQYDFDNIIE